jgi:hypothetical protein
MATHQQIRWEVKSVVVSVSSHGHRRAGGLPTDIETKMPVLVVAAGAGVSCLVRRFGPYLWDDYFHWMHTMGPLFLVPGVTGVVAATALFTSTIPVVAVAGALLLASSRSASGAAALVTASGSPPPTAGETLGMEIAGAIGRMRGCRPGGHWRRTRAGSVDVGASSLPSWQGTPRLRHPDPDLAVTHAGRPWFRRHREKKG